MEFWVFLETPANLGHIGGFNGVKVEIEVVLLEEWED